ncbi:tyrosine-type recombinase/integrase [Streptomyces sp. NPDC006923]|uniref:tyrosine-type recombinase/integrase n=1 Tax=Streptomyces sp. NPDC006923 TaxID=3155355 RepID=UPI00340CE2B9
MAHLIALPADPSDSAAPLAKPYADLAVTSVQWQILAGFAERRSHKLKVHEHAALDRIVDPLDRTMARWDRSGLGTAPRTFLLREMHRRRSPFWRWDETVWLEVVGPDGSCPKNLRFSVTAMANTLCGQRRLHARAGLMQLHRQADLVFGADPVRAAIDDVIDTLTSWNATREVMRWQIANAVVDILLSNGSPDLEDVSDEILVALVAEYEPGTARRNGIFKVSRVLADRGIITKPLTNNHQNTGPRAATLADVPPAWLEWAQRWRKLALQEPATVRTMFSTILVAGRWAAEKHPEAIAPDQWTRDMAAEYVADTMSAVNGQWAGHNSNKTTFGKPLGASGKANRMDSLRGFFCDLIEWEWITPKFDPRRVLSLPLSVRSQLGPNPRIIDDASWAKLMAAGLTLNSEDLPEYGSPAARRLGRAQIYYPIQMIRALVGVWLFGGCRIDEIRRLEPDCVIWDQGHDETTGEPFQICLLRVPANKTSPAFNKPVDPVVGQLIEAWNLVRPPQPRIEDRKTRQPKEHLFCVRGQLIGKNYLNDYVIPELCRKAGIPESDSRGALTSHRARATIATQLLNAREPLTLVDLQQWLGHKHAASTRHYAKILQRTLSAAYKKADYFARNVRTIQVLVDRESILTGAAADGQPWKYYDLGDGYCTYDFFAKCPHRLSCARCPFYKPKDSSAGQILAVKDGIAKMLETVDLTDDEREALEGDRDAISALAKRLADTPTPAGPTPAELGTADTFIPLTKLLGTLAPTQPGPTEGAS